MKADDIYESENFENLGNQYEDSTSSTMYDNNSLQFPIYELPSDANIPMKADDTYENENFKNSEKPHKYYISSAIHDNRSLQF